MAITNVNLFGAMAAIALGGMDRRPSYTIRAMPTHEPKVRPEPARPVQSIRLSRIEMVARAMQSARREHNGVRPRYRKWTTNIKKLRRLAKLSAA